MFGVVTLVAATVLTSCNTLPTQERNFGKCGIGLVIWLRQPKTSQYQYFTIEGGVFAYGAGVTALNMKTFWQTDLSIEQCQKFASARKTEVGSANLRRRVRQKKVILSQTLRSIGMVEDSSSLPVGISPQSNF